MKVVAFFHLKEVRWSLHESTLARWRERFPQRRGRVGRGRAPHLPAALADAEIFVGWRIPPEHFAAARAAALDALGLGRRRGLSCSPSWSASDVILTNSTGLHSVCIPEHVLGQMLVLARNFHEAQRLQQRGEWNRFAGDRLRQRRARAARRASSPSSAPGRSAPTWRAWRRRSACTCGCCAAIRSGAVAGAEAVCGPERLHELLGWADFVVLACRSPPRRAG